MNNTAFSNSFCLSLKRFCIAGCFSLFFLLQHSFAGHKITGSVSHFEGQTVYLSMLYGGNQYLVDTATAVKGTFVFESFYNLQSGVYLVVLPPSKSFLVLVDQKITDFSFKADMSDIDATIQFDRSPDNTAYYDYIKFFLVKRKYLDEVKTAYDTQVSEPDKVALLEKMHQLKKDVTTYQSELVARNPGTLTAAIIKCELPVELPTFDGSPEEIQLKKYLFQKAHFFDNTDLNDERLIRSPKNVLVDRVEHYLDHLTVQQPDSIIASVDFILAKTEKVPVSYRFFLTHIFNKYREMKTIGMDAVYVHIAEQYIASGKASWIEADEKEKVLAAVKTISPTLIGKKAPDFMVQLEDGKNISLSEIKSPYTVLVFWAPNCAHCQKSMPILNTFQQSYKKDGVQVFAVCTKLNEQEKSCWDYLDKNQFTNWITASDKIGGSSQIHSQYNITTTPKIYVLGSDKKIIAKDIGVEHLEEVMKRILKK